MNRFLSVSLKYRLLELSGPDAEHYEVISHEDTCRLAQEGGYVVLIYRRQVVRHKAASNHNGRSGAIECWKVLVLSRRTDGG